MLVVEDRARRRRAQPAAALLLAALAALATLATLAGCRAAPPVDVLRLGVPAEVDVNGRGAEWFTNQQGKPLRLDDVVWRTLPASPPSRLRYTVDVPAGGRLHFACGIPPERHGRPGVEFVVKVRRGGDERVVFTRLVDPLRKPADRRWLPFDVDLSRAAGRGVELIFETRGFERDDDARRAFWGAPVIAAPGRRAPLVIVYLVDTLRADHTGVYGYARDTTPHLDAFAQDAVVFDSAVAHASWTKPSVASLFTALLPSRHKAVQLRDPLDSELVTLPEMLHAKGYATGAAVANAVIYLPGSNFEQGFDVFTGLHGPRGHASKDVDAAAVVDAALAFLDARRGLPTFLYVHTMDPHVPYTPPPPFDRKYEPHPAPGHPAVDPRTDYKEPLDRERMIAQYDGDIAYGDQEFGRFVRELRARGLYDGALFVFLADHGEEFLDHGKWLHGRSVFDELVRIPLVVKFPGRAHAGRRVARQVQEVDVLPTVLRDQQLPVPDETLIAGRPLQLALEDGAADDGRPAVAEISHRGFVAHALRTTRDKYIQRFSPEEDELYFDLESDPGERHDRLAGSRERARVLKSGLEAAMTPNVFRHVLRFSGPARYEVELVTRGWVDAVEAQGLAAGESQRLEDNGRRLRLRVEPRAGQPREVSFRLRPRGARVRLQGTRDGRPLQPRDVRLAAAGAAPAAVPFALPDVESEHGDVADDVFRAPEPLLRAALDVWLRLEPGGRRIDFGHAAREHLRALGYIGP